MSIIGHSIQGNIANVHAALKDQLAGQAAQADEDAKRTNRVRREEEIARAEVREADETRQSRPETAAKVARRAYKRQKALSLPPPAPDEKQPDTPTNPQGRIDFFA
jgi:hypothetical protein